MITRQFVVFVFIGLLSTLVDIVCMKGLISVGIHYALATTYGFALGLFVNYLGHARITFRVASSVATMIRFSVVVLVNYFITMIFVIITQRWLGNALVGKVASLPVVAINGYFWSRHWVFR